MRRVVAVFCLAVLAVMFVACAGGSPPPAPGSGGGKPIIKVTAVQLAQDLTDSKGDLSTRYGSNPLEITGTVSRLTKPGRYDLDPGPDDDVEMILFIVQVTDKVTGGQTPYELRCVFRPSLTAEQRKSLGLEKGKQVTLRGWYEVGYRDQPLAGIGNCTIVNVSGP
jgi:hypothetical protein